MQHALQGDDVVAMDQATRRRARHLALPRLRTEQPLPGAHAVLHQQMLTPSPQSELSQGNFKANLLPRNGVQRPITEDIFLPEDLLLKHSHVHHEQPLPRATRPSPECQLRDRSASAECQPLRDSASSRQPDVSQRACLGDDASLDEAVAQEAAPMEECSRQSNDCLDLLNHHVCRLQAGYSGVVLAMPTRTLYAPLQEAIQNKHGRLGGIRQSPGEEDECPPLL
mmetsp:Transcript_77994/g.198184  ORF Transcript_77994/g.198184 Transcript_77994/m.198184 type:complete len:225 (+) Transcript_77994:142-816(+)